MSIFDQASLPRLIRQAHDSRRDVIRITPSYRLFHGAADGIPGLEIDVFNREIFLLRTRDAAMDTLVSTLTAFLENDFGARTVWLKNHFTGRLARNLELADRVLLGPIPDNAQEIQDGKWRFRWEWNRNDPFPLEDRPLRLRLNRLLEADDSRRPVLCVGFETDTLIASTFRERVRAETPSMAGLQIAEATGLLRDLTERGDSFGALALDFTFVRNVEKNKTALFHFWNAALALLDQTARLFVKTAHAPELAQLLAAICAKRNCTLKILKIESTDGDFPKLPKRIATPVFVSALRA